MNGIPPISLLTTCIVIQIISGHLALIKILLRRIVPNRNRIPNIPSSLPTPINNLLTQDKSFRKLIDVVPGLNFCLLVDGVVKAGLVHLDRRFVLMLGFC